MRLIWSQKVVKSRSIEIQTFNFKAKIIIQVKSIFSYILDIDISFQYIISILYLPHSILNLFRSYDKHNTNDMLSYFGTLNPIP